MLKRDYNYEHFLKLPHQWITQLKNPNIKRAEAYLNTTRDDQVRIRLIGRYCSPIRLYNICQQMERHFNDRMMTYIEGAVEGGMPAAEALSRFFDKYDISEDDMLETSAYKRWQRYCLREKKRDFIPLW